MMTHLRVCSTSFGMQGHRILAFNVSDRSNSNAIRTAIAFSTKQNKHAEARAHMCTQAVLGAVLAHVMSQTPFLFESPLHLLPGLDPGMGLSVGSACLAMQICLGVDLMVVCVVLC